MSISDSSLRNSIFLEIKGILGSATLSYYDNADDVVSDGVTIRAAYVDSPDSLPQIVINTANVAKDEPSFSRSNMTNTIQVMLDVYARKMKNIDYICDQLDNITGLKTISGLMLTNWEEVPAFSPENENKIHLKSITLTYKRR